MNTILRRPEFQRGIVYPRWYPSGYGPTDTVWQEDIRNIKVQTGTLWIEMPVLFFQGTSSSTEVQLSQSTPNVEAFASGVRTAHLLGYSVFFTPLIGVWEPGGWAGSVELKTEQQQQAWFESYWNTLKPYAQAAADNGVEQMAIATELEWLQQHVPAWIWEQLTTRTRSIFKKTLTYDMNWSSLDYTPPDWFKNPELAMIGVSCYIPLIDVAQRVDSKGMPKLWQDKVRTKLDDFATKLGKRVLLSEIGYRNSTDALYRTWEAKTTAPPDPEQQAAAYEAALTNVFDDPQIAGTFFWGWDDVERFTIKGQPAVQILHKWYTLPQSQ